MKQTISTSQSVVLTACATAATILAITKAYQYSITKKKNTNNDHHHQLQSSNNNNQTSTHKKTMIPNEIGINVDSTTDNSSLLCRIQSSNTITIAYASTTGTCESFAKSLYDSLQSVISTSSSTTTTTSSNIKIQICTVNELDWWDELLNNDNDNTTTNTTNNTISNNHIHNIDIPPMVIFILPTWTNGTLPDQYASLLSSLDEISHDWRVAPMPLRNNDSNNNINEEEPMNKKRNKKFDTKTIQVASFGMGSTAYDKSTFCKPAKDVFKYFMKLGAKSLLVSHGRGVVGTGDDDAGDCKQSFQEWKGRVVDRLKEIIKQNQNIQVSVKSSCCQHDAKIKDTSCACQEEKSALDSEGCCKSNNNEVELMDDDVYSEDDDDDSYDESDYDEEKEPDVMDLEDIGNAMQNASSQSSSKKVIKEMVTPKQAIALKKEGYRIIGTHSAVKLCRWTKHQLRGRGGCYKHTFYGITSYQCMEATPSLACANKCVFCWRHHKNPVGREWRWKIDDPNDIVDQAVKEHVAMIKEAKGIPGVKKERWEEAHTVRHCALSLVGEPIMYPRIDEFLADLHSRSISTFLVTNGQHPTAIENLRPITQLYVSVDASTPETLEAIDRPLFKDAWDRLRSSLKCLKVKGQRTVARLTVVKGWNSDEIEGYAKLIALGHCSLVEVKGVTFCGKSDASNLNMTNTPWHHEVVALTQNLQKELSKLRAAAGECDERIPEYGLACEHKHSCSVLLARVDQFAVNDPITGARKWRTWIDYDKFHRLAARHAEDPTFKFGVEDYVEDTPSWAVFGAEEEGFDPTDTRHRRKQKYPKYTQFDENGIPTHDDNGSPLDNEERLKLTSMMIAKKKELGDGVSVIDLKGGEKVIDDASLMFRGLTITK